MFSPICFTNFSQFEQLKKKLLIGPKQVLFFSVCQLKKKNHNKYSSKKFVDSEFYIGEII